MAIRPPRGERIFLRINAIFLFVLALMSLFPIINILAVSFSSAAAAMAGEVGLWPVEFNLSAYRFVMSNDIFFSTFFVSLQRVAIGVPLNLFLIILTAYPLAQNPRKFRGRGLYSWFFLFSILFSGGLIPYFLVVEATGLINSIWALLIPLAAPVYYVIILMNFFKSMPSDLVEAAAIDGAGHFTTLWQIFVPISKPALATITLLCFIMHWNSWFDGLLFINNPKDYPLQSYLQTIVVTRMDINSMARNPEQWKLIQLVAERTVKSAQIFLATIPVMIVYPYLQRNFTRGLLVGSIKG